MTTTELRERWAKLVADGNDLTAAAEAEGRELSAEELGKITNFLNEARKLKTQFQAIEAVASEHREATTPREPVAGRPSPVPSGIIVPDRRSIGQRYMESEEWTAFRGKVAPNGHFSEKNQFGAGPSVQFRNLLPPTRQELRATLLTGTSDTSAGALVFNDVMPGLNDQGLQRPLTIRDVITVGSTDGDTVEYVQMTAQTNAAATVAEASVYTGTTSGLKPISEFALAKVTTTVKTIAHALVATKRALSDAGQMRTLIDNFLRYGLEEELEDQIVIGNTVGEDFTGIANVVGVQAQAWDTDLFTTTRKARTKVRTVGRAKPTAYLFNPADWERIDLLQDNEQRFYGAGPFALTDPKLWGLPVVESEAVPSGTGYVGDFRKCVLWEREQASIQVSDSHADFFLRNLVAILAEMRAAFGILQPNALVEMDLTA